jgi:hypothetical protein
MGKKTKNTKNTIRKNTRKPSRKMNKKTIKNTNRNYGKKGGFLGHLVHGVNNNNAAYTAAHTPYTTGKANTIHTNFHPNPLVTQPGKEKTPSVLAEYITKAVTKPQKFIHIRPPPRKPGTGTKTGVGDDDDDDPLDDFKKKYNWLNAYSDEVDKRKDKLHENVKEAENAIIKSNPNDKKSINF